MYDWEHIRSQHGPLVWNTIWRILRHESDVMDCYQEVFLEAFRTSQCGPIVNLPGLLKWLAVRRSLDVLRKRKPDVQTVPGYDLEELAQINPTNTSGEIAELLDAIRNELNSLSAGQAQAFWLCCVEEMTYREAADVMNINAKHVGMLVHRARRHLRKTLVDWDVAREA